MAKKSRIVTRTASGFGIILGDQKVSKASSLRKSASSRVVERAFKDGKFSASGSYVQADNGTSTGTTRKY